MTIAEILFKAIMEGGAFGVAALGWLAWWYERRANREASAKLIELATAQIDATLRHEGAISANTKLMERMLER